MARTFSSLRFALDAVVGAAVFFGLTFALLGPSAAAQLITTGSAPYPLAAAIPAPSQPLLLVLAAVFSALFALNLAFLRHVRQTHAPARYRPRVEPSRDFNRND